MEDLTKYLEKQLEVSKELNEILNSLNELDNKEKELLYIKNESLISELNSVNDENVQLTSDRVTNLKNKIESLLSDKEICKNTTLKRNLISLYKELNFLSSKINRIENNLETIISKSIDSKKVPNNVSTKMEVTTSLENKNIIEPKISNNNTHTKKIPKTNTKKETTNVKKDNFEFNIGSNFLNFIGVILILIALIIFGNHIYTNYLTKELKGLFLFIVSGLIVVIGEKVLPKKIPKFSTSISALGIGALYVSLLINYLALYTLNSISAIIVSLIITALSLFISSKKDSDIIRIIALIGGYGSLIPMSYLDDVQSYITIGILLMISISNACVPTKKDIFVVYSTFLNMLFYMIINCTLLLSNSASAIYLIAIVVLNNYMFIKAHKNKYIDYLGIVLAIIGVLLSISLLAIYRDYKLAVGIIVALIHLGSYYFDKGKLKGAFYFNFIVMYYMLLILYSYKIYDFQFIFYIALILLTLYLTFKHSKNMEFICISILVTLSGLFKLAFPSSKISCAIYFVFFSILLWILCKKYKNNLLIILFKHGFFISSVICVVYYEFLYARLNYINDNIVICLLTILYILIITNVDRLKDSSVKDFNNMALVIGLLIIICGSYYHTIQIVINLIIMGWLLALLNNVKYAEIEFVKKHSLLIYSLYATLGIYLLSYSVSLSSELTNLIFSISLMILAFINVWIGFKFNVLEVRKYGLILSLIVCAKLILIDLYSYDFVIKAGLFLVVGIVALTISYIYSKLEQELQNKEKVTLSKEDNNSSDNNDNKNI